MGRKLNFTYFLLLVQGFILAHTLVPHHHHIDDQHCIVDVHGHGHTHRHDHQHTDDEGKAKDASIFDIIFSYVTHSAEGVVFVSQDQTRIDSTNSDNKKIDGIAVQQPVTIKYLIRGPIIYDDPATFTYSDQYNLNFSLRGPPFFIV